MLDSKNKGALAKNLVSCLASHLIGLTPQYSFAIDQSLPPPVSEAPQPGAPTPQAAKLSEAELEKLLAPIALYPDALLAQLLPASAYPQRWLDKNTGADAGPILGLNTRSPCSAISTTALASIGSFIMAAKEPMSGLSRRRFKRSCPRRSLVAGTAT